MTYDELRLKVRAYKAYQAADPVMYLFVQFPQFTLEEMKTICSDKTLYGAMFGEVVSV